MKKIILAATALTAIFGATFNPSAAFGDSQGLDPCGNKKIKVPGCESPGAAQVVVVAPASGQGAQTGAVKPPAPDNPSTEVKQDDSTGGDIGVAVGYESGAQGVSVKAQGSIHGTFGDNTGNALLGGSLGAAGSFGILGNQNPTYPVGSLDAYVSSIGVNNPNQHVGFIFGNRNVVSVSPIYSSVTVPLGVTISTGSGHVDAQVAGGAVRDSVLDITAGKASLLASASQDFGKIVTLKGQVEGALTLGGQDDLDKAHALVAENGTGLLFAANFDATAHLGQHLDLGAQAAVTTHAAKIDQYSDNLLSGGSPSSSSQMQSTGFYVGGALSGRF